MSVCAVMLVKDEADIVEYTLRHLRDQVDQVIVADNKSSDGTRGILRELQAETSEAWLTVQDDYEQGYWQSRKTTRLAMAAYQQGFQWVLPCDADEYWYAPDGRTISAYLDGLTPDVQIVTANLYNHLPTSRDVVSEPNPFRRIGWRKREHGALPKVCARTRPDLVIHAGNHGASTAGTATTVNGLVVRHYSWRSPDQYLRKIRNGEAAYKQTDLPPDVGAHWRMWSHQPDEAIIDHYHAWFKSDDPAADVSLIYDPAP